MVEAGKAAGLRVSIEPHVDLMAQTPERALKLIEAVPGLEITLDWAQLTYQNSPQASILSLLPHTRHIQMRQAARGHLQMPFDKGKIDLPRVMDDLQAQGYEGVIGVEIVNTAGRYGITAVNAVRESVRLRDTLRTLRG